MCCSRGRATTTIDRSRRPRRSAVVAGSTALVLLTAMGTPALAAPDEPGGGPPSAAPVVHVLDLSASSLDRQHPRMVAAARPGPDGRLAKPDSGLGWYVETAAGAEVGDDVTLTGEGVVQYPSERYGELPRAASSTRVVRHGHRTPGSTPGCDFGGEVVLDTAVEVTLTELAYDPARCRSLVQVSVTPDAAEEPPAPGAESGEETARASKKVADSGEIGTMAVRSFRARTRSQVREPAYPALAATSEIFASVNVYNGNPQYAPTTASYNSNHLGSSGWYRTSFSWSSYFGYSYARATVYANFKNDIAGRVLCGILWGSTYASHSPTVVRGYRDGTAQYSTNTSKSGNCSWLLRTNQTNSYSYL